MLYINDNLQDYIIEKNTNNITNELSLKKNFLNTKNIFNKFRRIIL